MTGWSPWTLTAGEGHRTWWRVAHAGLFSDGTTEVIVAEVDELWLTVACGGVRYVSVTTPDELEAALADLFERLPWDDYRRTLPIIHEAWQAHLALAAARQNPQGGLL